ncbi:hypothetical protein H2200_005927 [Cladophialophora chaetospira]|uniref:FAS1 domain-containing protein n=1 Tax=Cladophialophora chaetospira TaxID=386627 RepID=A0AA39CIM5_9EURO|nr:hypothetical protein H2200_005927 [Cladophialophora chaetospira]
MLWIIFLLLALAWSAVGQGTNNLTLVLSELPQLTKFTSYLMLFPDLLAELENGNYTMLAPDNKAIDTYLNYVQSNQTNDPKAILAVLSYHVIPGVYTNVQLESEVQFLPTLLTDPAYANVTGGQRVGVYPTDAGVTFEAAYKHMSNITVPNTIYLGPSETGIIHIIDRVLEPPLSETATISVVGLDGVVAVQVSLPINPEVVGVDGTVSDWTFFAPNSSRRTTDPSLSDNSSTQAEFDAEEYHFVHGRVIYSPDFRDGMRIKTVEGKDLTLTIAPNGTTYVNDAKVLYTDYLISTGVVHVIEWALNPNDTEARPDLSNSSTSTNSTTAPSSSSSSLSTGAKAGIGVGVALGALLAIGLLFFFLRRRKRTKRSTETGDARTTQNKQLALVEMPQPEKPKSHEMYSPGSGQEWEMDTNESHIGRVYEMQ